MSELRLYSRYLELFRNAMLKFDQKCCHVSEEELTYFRSFVSHFSQFFFKIHFLTNKNEVR